MRVPFDAVVLAGGRSSRFGADKLAAVVAGSRLLDRVLAAAAMADRRIVVGSRREVEAEVLWTREDPPGGGPAAAMVTGLRLVTAPTVVLLAGDLPYVTSATVDRLVVSGARGDGAVLVDAAGRRQHLCAAVSTAAVRERATTRDSWHARPLHSLLDRLRLVEVPAVGSEAHDVDTPDDLVSEQEHR